MPFIPPGDDVRTVGHVDEQPARIDPDTDRATAALVLHCSPNQVGYCARCQGLTARYGPNAQVLCPHCQANERQSR